MIKKTCALLIFAAIVLSSLAFSSAAFAQSGALFDSTEEKTSRAPAPDLSEYTALPKGLLLIQNDAPEITDSFSLNAEQEKNACDLDDCIFYYSQKNYTAALPGLMIAARKGNSKAEEILGLMYKSGQGVPKDVTRGFELLLSAAEQGSPLAQRHVAALLAEGIGVQKNLVLALTWMEIATASTSNPSEKNSMRNDRDALAAQLSRQERRKALDNAKRWLNRRGEGHLLKTEN